MSREFVEFFASFRLTPAQRRISQTLVEHSNDVPSLTASEVAELANVSQPSVTRLAVAVGYSGYAELRHALVQLLNASPSGSELDEPNEFQRAINSEIENLRALGVRLSDRTRIRQAGALIVGAPVVVALGHRSAAHIAGYFGHFASRVHGDVRVLTCAGSELAESLAAARSVGAGVLVAFLHAPYPADTIDALEFAQQLGFRLVLISDSDVVSGSDWAEVLLRADISSRLIFDTHAATFTAASLLVQAICDEDPVGVQRRLEEQERSLRGRRV
ncbi:MurR/RpiR family transcriptional regulator [Streptomyces shenzhenensis]|uniref:MurR/RpiR family transcriptional regulator n=1 Tax=Streptomyces shenzhenensis TaxID=943815 RepID=UPI003D91702E